MEEAVTGRVNETKATGVESDEIWKAHVLSASKFRGSDAEYCRRNGLGPSMFRAQKRKYRVSKPQPESFLKIECAEVSRSQSATARPRELAMPDARWTAEFIAVLMGLR